MEAFKVLYDFLTTHEDDEKYRYAMVGYRLGNTLTENGSVARGCCVTMMKVIWYLLRNVLRLLRRRKELHIRRMKA